MNIAGVRFCNYCRAQLAEPGAPEQITLHGGSRLAHFCTRHCMAAWDRMKTREAGVRDVRVPCPRACDRGWVPLDEGTERCPEECDKGYLPAHERERRLLRDAVRATDAYWNLDTLSRQETALGHHDLARVYRADANGQLLVQRVIEREITALWATASQQPLGLHGRIKP